MKITAETNHDLDPKELLKILTAVKKGDFTVRLPEDLTGIDGKIADTLNGIIEINQKVSNAVIKISDNVGKTGKLSQRIKISDENDAWSDTVSSINSLIDDLSFPVIEMTRVINAVGKGNLTQFVPMEIEGRELQGEFKRSAKSLNTVVEQLASFTEEVNRVSKEVGVEGKLGGQAVGKGFSGSWKELTDNVNSMANNLTAQVRNIAEVTVAVAGGDLSKKIMIDVRGEFLQLKDTMNTMVDQLRSFASEVTRVAREVGTEGKLGGQAVVPGVGGVWKELTDNVNNMGSNLTSQVRNIAQVTTAVAKGDLSRKITVDVKGEMLELKTTMNTMVDQLNAFAGEVIRVANEVGTDGLLGGQANVPGIAGIWKDLTLGVNSMANNLTEQVRNIAEVTTAVANGDLTKKITVDAKGEIQELKNTINTMVEQLGSFAAEVTRVAKEVGTEGKLGGQGEVKGVSGTWKNLTDNVNSMAANLTSQVRNIALVTTAVAKGDLTKKITVDAKGEIQELKNTINTMVDQLSSFASEVTRVASEVGSEGKLGGQAEVKGISGTWKNLTDNVNLLTGNLTSQVRNIALVTTAVANGDLSQKITVDAKGEILQLKNTMNTMVDQLNSFSAEVTRVAREVGTEGKLGGQAKVEDISGTWKDLTNNVNMMADNLTSQVRNIAQVTTAVANGDLTSKITVDAKGEIMQLKNTINTMVDQLSAFASEVTRVAREVGTDGKLGGQADVKGVSGTWKNLTDNVNQLAQNLTVQVRNIALVTTAVANGDLSQKITVDAKGEIQELKNTINTMVGQLSSFASEVTRVAREVGTEGQLGGQAEVKDVSGTWKDLTENVNLMATNLTNQVRNIAVVTTSVANGDLTQKITVDAKGEIQELKNTVNIMVDQLSSFAAEVTRVASEVGTDGKLGGQADVKGVSGTWKALTDSVNMLASNLTNQVRNIAVVTTSVANGDLAQKITVDAKGEILVLKETINKMVDRLNSFAAEVTRVSREVGTEGKLGGQATVKDVSGTWKDLTENVNLMATNLTNQVRNIALVTTAVANGDLTKKITVDAKGEIQELKETINIMVDQLSSFAAEVTRVAREVGTDGKLGGQAVVKGVGGTWKDLTENVNLMATNLTDQVRNIAVVTTAVANGNLSRKITVDAKGEILELKDTINRMVDQLNAFAAEVTRVAREVGTEGKLGGQALVPGVAGTWKDLTDNVNIMANNLTDQVRNIAKVVTAIATGDLRQKLNVMAKGEIAQLTETINNMIDTLALFADQVTGVAREVGVEGKLGAQADVPGASGTWKGLTDNVNQLAANLTTQVRAISEVTIAVTKGDLTRSIKVDARGEVEDLKNSVNEMISNLRETTFANTEQDWLKTNLAKFTKMLQGQRDLITVARTLLSELSPLVKAQHALFYILDSTGESTMLKMIASYAFKERKNLSNTYRIGEGLIGQCAFEKQRIMLTNVPSDYIQISSGLGEATPLNIIVLPIIFEGQVKAVIELASFELFSSIHQLFLDQLTESIGIVLNTIEANQRTEDLLKQSTSLASELQNQQEELQQTNEELENKAVLLSEQNKEVEKKNKEIEVARKAIEEKAEQLSITSKYKSEFLSNMSHELRTPLNSLLILSEQLTRNPEKNLTEKQVEFAKIINDSGNDLLSLITDILDLSKIESGTVTLDLDDIKFSEIVESSERTFRHLAEGKEINFRHELDKNLPRSIHTDGKRLQQILKNLLSNAFKFTRQGEIKVSIACVNKGWNIENQVLNQANQVIAFTVKDTGIGIPPEKQKIIFEAFQQADGTTSRKYGGTGLGLAISREIAQLLGGEIRLESAPGHGSTFILYLSDKYSGFSGPQEDETFDDGNRRQTLETVRTFLTEDKKDKTSVAKPKFSGRQVYADDREQISEGDRVLLIIEDDPNFAGILLDNARNKGFKGIVSTEGESALSLVKTYSPDAITLDIKLPDIDGWTVLDRLKQDPGTRHIPVHIISADTEEGIGLKRGAIAHIVKPVSKEALDTTFTKIIDFAERKMKKLLIVDDNLIEREMMTELIGNGDVETTAVATGEQALDLLKKERFDCLIVDLALPGMSGIELIEKINTELKLKDLPVIVYTAKDLTKKEQTKLNKLARDVIKKDMKTPEILLDEANLFLHRVTANLPESKRKMLEKIYNTDAQLSGKQILVVDDDIRNIFSITSLLESHELKVIAAESGKQALDILRKNPHPDLIIMDIMMPEMDGYEATQLIRKEVELKSIPIIALTAKAMKGDREKCIAAGASDYISKPINSDQLISLLRVWLYK
ncbi:MAG: HAMP domain-containing protein [Prolixibacteraceae bacterium]